MQGRLSTWPVPAAMAWAGAGVEYAIKVLRGELPRDRIDDAALEDCIKSYVKDHSGVDVEAAVESYRDPETGEVYNNYKLLLMGYITF